MSDFEKKSNTNDNILQDIIERTYPLSKTKFLEWKEQKAIKVYTVNDESRYMLIQNIPAIGLTDELKKFCTKFGRVDDFYLIPNYPPPEEFTHVFYIKFGSINEARFAKKKLKNREFFGQLIHICYAPELETVEECSEKLMERFNYVQGYRIRTKSNKSSNFESKYFNQDKKKNEFLCQKNFEQQQLKPLGVDSSSAAGGFDSDKPHIFQSTDKNKRKICSSSDTQTQTREQDQVKKMKKNTSSPQSWSRKNNSEKEQVVVVVQKQSNILSTNQKPTIGKTTKEQQNEFLVPEKNYFKSSLYPSTEPILVPLPPTMKNLFKDSESQDTDTLPRSSTSTTSMTNLSQEIQERETSKSRSQSQLANNPINNPLQNYPIIIRHNVPTTKKQPNRIMFLPKS